jgi:hypothetical protein
MLRPSSILSRWLPSVVLSVAWRSQSSIPYFVPLSDLELRQQRSRSLKPRTAQRAASPDTLLGINNA